MPTDTAEIAPTPSAGRPGKATTPGAQATARWRQRQEQGVVRVTVEVGADDIELLVASRWLAAGEAHDRHAVGDAVARLLDRVLEQLGGRAGHM